MLDGLMAVENGKSSKQGDVFNEFPDRIADVVLFVGAGYAAHSGEFGVTLGWLCAALALGTAYIRTFGARYSSTQDYSGPLAKPQRMFVLTVGSLLCAIEASLCGSIHFMLATLLIACLGTTLTCVNRTSRLLKVMEKL
jgi:phosphatidylglycerophosphate synthase